MTPTVHNLVLMERNVCVVLLEVCLINTEDVKESAITVKSGTTVQDFVLAVIQDGGNPVKGVCGGSTVSTPPVVDDDHCAKYGYVDAK